MDTSNQKVDPEEAPKPERRKRMQAKPWRWEVILVGCLSILISSGISLATNASVGDVQDSRHDACVQQNQNHDQGLKALDDLEAAAIKETPEQADQIRTSTQSFRVFVEALVPRRDCDEFIG